MDAGDRRQQGTLQHDDSLLGLRGMAMEQTRSRHLHPPGALHPRVHRAGRHAHAVFLGTRRGHAQGLQHLRFPLRKGHGQDGVDWLEAHRHAIGQRDL